MSRGIAINWNGSNGNTVLVQNPLYVKYNSTPLADIVLADVKADLGAVLPTADNGEICAYLSWVIRCINLIQV